MFVAPAALIFVVQLHATPVVLPPPQVPPPITQQTCIKPHRFFAGIVQAAERAVAELARSAVR